MKLTENQKSFLNKVVDGKWTLNPETGLVDVDGGVFVPDLYIMDGEMPVKFGEVTDYFNCSNNNLITLRGAPNKVYGNFDCSNNRLKTLAGSPSKVIGYFDASDNFLTDLEGSPHTIGAFLSCNDNSLTSLEGAPSEIRGALYMDLPHEKSKHRDKLMSQLIRLMDSGVIKNKDDYQPFIDAWLNEKLLTELNSDL